MIISETVHECLRHPGIVAIATAGSDGHAHIVNTWNRYVIITENEELLIPAAGFRKTERNIQNNSYAEMTIGSHEVEGSLYTGTGFLLTGTVRFETEGPLYEMIKAKCGFPNRVLVFTPASCHRTI